MSNSDNTIQKLPETLSKVGNNYKLHKRGERTLLYAEVNDQGRALAYEVFQIRIRKAGFEFGKHYPTRERYPGNEDFGQWAWWCHNLEKAMDYFTKLESGGIVGNMTAREPSGEEEQLSEISEVHPNRENSGVILETQ